MTTYKSLYHLMVRSMSEAIDLYDEGKGILAREVLKKALLDAEEQVITHDIIPRRAYRQYRFSRKLKKIPSAASAAMPLARSLPPNYRHSRLTIVRRGCDW